MSTSPVIQLHDVTVFHRQEPVLQRVNLSLQSGEFVFLIGRTGSGKSALLKTLYAALPLRAGEGIVAGYDLRRLQRKQIVQLRRQLGVVFQDFHLLMDRNVQENLAFVLKATGWRNRDKRQARIDAVLEQVGLEWAHQKMPYRLSSGEQQRLAIARALLNTPQVLLADEPTGNLDPTVGQEIFDLFLRISQQGTAVLMSTHNHTFLHQQPLRIVSCENGQLAPVGAPSVAAAHAVLGKTPDT